MRGDPRRDSEAAVDGLMDQPLGHLGQDDVGLHAIDQPVNDRGRPDEVDWTTCTSRNVSANRIVSMNGARWPKLSPKSSGRPRPRPGQSREGQIILFPDRGRAPAHAIYNARGSRADEEPIM
ncbi:hypothetical protein ACLBYG_08295 [Methylobacterium sp. D53M]|jgi:hypothetical protein